MANLLIISNVNFFESKGSALSRFPMLGVSLGFFKTWPFRCLSFYGHVFFDCTKFLIEKLKNVKEMSITSAKLLYQ